MVSVIIPNYNHATYLKQRIETVLNQSYQNFEVIILDDCSKDNSKEVIEHYRNHPKVSNIVYNEVNSGSVFKQWEKGVGLAKGELIWIAESDDYAHSCYLEKMIPFLQSDPELGFVYCNVYKVNTKGAIAPITFAEKRNKDLSTSKWSKSYVKPGKEEIKENFIRACTINNVSGVLFKKEALLKVAPFDRSFKYLGDWYCYLKLCNHYNIGYLHETLNYYRDHEVNTSKSFQNNLIFLEEYFKLFDWISSNINYVKPHIIKKYFHQYTRHSVIKDWNIKVALYKKLHSLNPTLFWSLLKYNLLTAVTEKLN